MNKPMLLAVTALAAAPLMAAGQAADPACGPARPCCSADLAAAAPLSNRSLYQLDTSWIDDAGHAVQLASLRGQPVVLAMFFASCEYACPVLVGDMQRLRATLPADVREKARLVLVSFDTARDTPAALRAYRERMSLDGAWTLFHGGAADVRELAMLLGVKYKRGAAGQYAHSNLITVLNREGEIAFQCIGLPGDIAETARAIALAAR